MKKWDLPNGWEWKNLKHISTICAGNSAPQDKKYFVNGKYNFVRTSDLGLFGINSNLKESRDKINDLAIKELKFKVIPENSILIPKSGASTFLNHRALTGSDLYISSHLAAIIPNECVNPKYVFHWSKTLDAKTLTNEGDYPSLRLSELENAEIPVPPLETQKRIVAILDKAEEIKRLRVEANAHTQKLIQSIFLDMFGDPVKNPNQHAVIELGRIADIVSGITKGRKTTEPTSNVPYLRVANVQDGYLDLTEIKEIDATKSEICYYSLKDGDILLTEGGDPDKLGRGAVWHGQIPGCIHQNHVFRVRLTQADILSDYLSLLIGSNYGKMYFLKCAKQTTGIASINSSQLKKFPVLIPPIGDQQQFSESVQSIKNVAGHQKKSIDNIDSILSLLLSNVFRGRMTK